MAKKRPPIPKAVEDKLLVSCKHSCCLCERFGVEIHHIDGNPSNNQEDNLIPLCGHCAGLAHVDFPPAARIHGISPDHLKLYKKNWIEKCASIPANIFTDISLLKEALMEVKGEIKRIREERE